MTVDHVELGSRSRQTRAAAGLSQTVVAQALGISPWTHSRIGSGERPLDGDELAMRSKLHAYLELEAYLTSQGIA